MKKERAKVLCGFESYVGEKEKCNVLAETARVSTSSFYRYCVREGLKKLEGIEPQEVQRILINSDLDTVKEYWSHLECIKRLTPIEKTICVSGRDPGKGKNG